ncbi:ent-kaurene synthase-like 3 [Neltuma alba]|uniref:ent-kaurene synthase-like 3 n=1 Tax=Neltuma alba TaxID=207710 RepID=UPI0010A37F8A|nr:ent-kaurene synthase-like 3 [Prosopis alba]
MYLIGPKLPQAVAESSECNYVLDVLGLHGRYLNDVNGYQREKEQGKLVNSVGLRLISGSEEEEEEMKKKIKKKGEEKRKELLRLMVKKGGIIASTDVREVFWKMCRTLEVIYGKDDIIYSTEVPDEVRNIEDIVLTNPIVLGC